MVMEMAKSVGSINMVCFNIDKYKTTEVLVHMCCW